MSVVWMQTLWLSFFFVLCLNVGCHAFSDKAGSEGGQTEGDQTGAA